MILPASVVSHPPREVPLSTRLVVLSGGLLSWFGRIFAGFGMMFVILFAPQTDFASWFQFHGALETASGIIVSSEKTHASEGGSESDSGTPIFAHHYKFTAGGVAYQGTSYCVGGGTRENEPVTVEFPAGKPGVSRIHGMRRNVFGPFMAIVFIFPAVGLAIVGFCLWLGLKNLSLLVNGEMAQARLTGKDATGMKVNERTVYKVWFEFTDRTGAPQKTFARSSTPEQLEDRAFEPLFYDVTNPARTALLHNISGNVTLDERGRVNPCGLRALLGVIWAPLLALAFIFAGLWLHQGF